MAASTQWRIRCMGNQCGNSQPTNVGFANIEMAASPAGADECVAADAVARASASTTYYSPPSVNNYAPSMAFDTSGATVWWGGGRANHWIGWTFAAPIDIKEVRLTPLTGTLSAAMWLFAVEYNDGEDWVISWICYNPTWANDTQVTFTKPSPITGAARYWGLQHIHNVYGPGSSQSCQIVDLAMRVVPGSSDQTSGGTAISNSDYTNSSSQHFPISNAFDAAMGDTLMQGISIFYAGPYCGEALAAYDFGSGVTKNIVEMAIRRLGTDDEAPGEFRVVKSTNGRDWLIHSHHELAIDDYIADGNYYNTETAVVSTLSDLERTAAEGMGLGDAATALIIAVGAGMARIYADRVMESTTTTGTGNITVAGAVNGFQSFNAVCDDGDTFDYAIFAVDVNGRPTGAWETGRGTQISTGVIERTVVHESSNAGALVSFAAGTKQIIMSHNAVSAALYRFGSFFTTEPAANEVLMMHVATDEFFIPVDAAGAQFFVGNGPSVDTELSIQVNGDEIGTITIGDDSAVVFDVAAAVEIEEGDVISLVAPADSNGLSSCAFTFRGGLT